MTACQNCGTAPIPTRHKRYCSTCSPLASKLWKREMRRATSPVDAPSWLLAGWTSAEERRAYHREYMRRRRRTQKAARSITTLMGNER